MIQHGHFELSSGQHTDTYVQCSELLKNPKDLEHMAAALADTLEPVDMVVSPAVGGILIGFEVAKALSVPFAFTERVDGVMKLRRGFEIPDAARVLIIEDVVTTGRSAREVSDVVLEWCGRVVGLGAIVKRYAHVPGFPHVHALREVSAPMWDAESCPLCEQGLSLDTPGSRNLG